MILKNCPCLRNGFRWKKYLFTRYIRLLMVSNKFSWQFFGVGFVLAILLIWVLIPTTGKNRGCLWTMTAADRLCWSPSLFFLLSFLRHFSYKILLPAIFSAAGWSGNLCAGKIRYNSVLCWPAPFPSLLLQTVFYQKLKSVLPNVPRTKCPGWRVRNNAGSLSRVIHGHI